MAASKATIGKTKTSFTMDDSAHRIANIPYSNYLHSAECPAHAVVPCGLAQNASGEANARAIQRAVDKLSGNGGGVVCVPKGTYKISTIELKSGVTLFVPSGAVLVSLTYEENEASPMPLRHALIYAKNAHNIAVTGGGTIDGSGESYTNVAENPQPLYALAEFNLYTRVVESRKRIRTEKTSNRYNIINFHHCSSVVIDNIRFKDAANWTCVLSNSKSITVQNVVIDNNMHVANADGIDIVGSSSVAIKNCFIATADDGIVLKPINNKIQNVTVDGCTIASFANCFKIGTETFYDVSQIDVSNCTFFLPDGIVGGYAGIAIESADGSNISGVTVSNINMDSVSSPLLIWLGNRFKYSKKTVGSVSNIKIDNVTATNVELPMAVTGCESGNAVHYVKNISLSNFNVSYRNTGEALDVKENVSYASMADYPEITRVSHIYFMSHEMSSYWDLPCYGLFVRNVQGFKTRSINVVPRAVNTRSFSVTIKTQEDLW